MFKGDSSRGKTSIPSNRTPPPTRNGLKPLLGQQSSNERGGAMTAKNSAFSMISYAIHIDQFVFRRPGDDLDQFEEGKDPKEGSNESEIKIETYELKHAIDHNFKRDPKIAYYKVMKTFYFGGMKKEIMIPISMPNRVIIEPNPPRQGYSNFTWKGNNEYFLQKCLSKEEYIEMLGVLKNIGFNVYSIYREESRFLANTIFDRLCRFLWVSSVGTMIYLLVNEIRDEPDEVIFSIILVAACILLIIVLSIYNFFQTPNSNIFINYEEFMHQSIQKYFGELNA
jgi:hypothetical protein